MEKSSIKVYFCSTKVKVTFSLSLHVICKKTAPLSSCIVSHEKAVSPSSSMTPAESVATSNDCPHESPQTISYGKLLQNDCDSHGCREHGNTQLEMNRKQNNSIHLTILLPSHLFPAKASGDETGGCIPSNYSFQLQGLNAILYLLMTLLKLCHIFIFYFYLYILPVPLEQTQPGVPLLFYGRIWATLAVHRWMSVGSACSAERREPTGAVQIKMGLRDWPRNRQKEAKQKLTNSFTTVSYQPS